jgi:hypothetical protein
LPIFRMCVKFYPVKFIRRFGWAYSPHLQGRRVSQGRNQHKANSKQKMQGIFSSRMLVYYHKGTRRYIPRDGTPHNRLCENFNLNPDWENLRKKCWWEMSRP